MQKREQVTGVGRVTAHGRIRPVGRPVTVETQVHLHEPAHVVHDIAREAQSRQARHRHSSADRLVVVEGDAPPGQVLARARLADVVQQRGQSEAKVGPVGVGGLAVDRTLQDAQAVHVHVLVLVVFIDLQT